jgi:hypothetical protein
MLVYFRCWSEAKCFLFPDMCSHLYILINQINNIFAHFYLFDTIIFADPKEFHKVYSTVYLLGTMTLYFRFIFSKFYLKEIVSRNGLMDEESTGGMVFRRELPARGLGIHRSRIPSTIFLFDNYGWYRDVRIITAFPPYSFSLHRPNPLCTVISVPESLDMWNPCLNKDSTMYIET